jgi:hypothetical protein
MVVVAAGRQSTSTYRLVMPVTSSLQREQPSFLDQEKIQGSRGSNRENYKLSTFSRGSSSYKLRSGFELETFAFVGTIQWYVRRVGRYIVAGMEQPGRPERLQFLRIKNQAHQDVYKFKF